jgi:DNA helicase-2/ATP-dependent DNA helicase PcrA
MPLTPDLNALTPVQRAAVTHPACPLLLACGPGSGKTRILTHRIHWLIHQGLRPCEILALTFSRAAAAELIGRVHEALDLEAREIWAGTLHAFGAWLLRREAAAVARTPAFTILDRADTRRLVEQLCRDLALPGDPGSLVDGLERAKRGEPPAGRSADLSRLLSAYCARCREANALDFGDLLAEPVALLERDPGLRRRLRARFRAVLIDEAQDLCPLQHTLIEQLTGPDGAVTFGADDDQAIYGWRGADVRRLHAFEYIYRGGTVRALGENFRSTPEIVVAAARLIAHNRTRRAKPLRAVAPPGPAPVVRIWPNDRAEAEGLAAELSSWVTGTPIPIAVLARITACLRPVARACQSRGLTVQLITDRPLSERAAVRDVLSVCRVLLNPADWLAWERVVHLHPCGMGAKALAALRARIAAVGVVTALTEAARSRPRLGAILHQLDAWRAAPAPIHERVQAIVAWLDEARPVRTPAEAEAAAQRAADREGLATIAAEWDREGSRDLRAFLDAVALTEDGDTGGSGRAQIQALTLHAAKGLEFDTVVIVGMEEGLLPHYRHAALSDVEEERRLCYVGMTRAKRRLVLSVCAERKLWGRPTRLSPSRFLREAGVRVEATLTTAPVPV